MSSQTPDLATLLRQTHLDSHEEILKAANATLKKSKGDITAYHVRVVALLKLDRFEDAVRAFEEAGSALKERAQFEYAYALYKAGELQKAEEVASNGRDGERGIKHVLAQTTYRREKFDRAAEIYLQLVNSEEAVNEEGDLRINSAAVDAQLEWKGMSHLVHNKKPSREDLEAFESAYNAACGSIARGELAQGEVLLRRAKDLCTASEELSEEEKRAELLPIVTQQVYVLTRLGRNEEAAKLFEGVDPQDIPDLSTRHVGRVNSLAISADLTNPFLAHRLFHSTTQLPKNDLPFEYQSNILRQDESIMDLLCLKYPGVAHSTAEVLASQPSPTTSAIANSNSVLNAAAHARGQADKAALKAILPLLEKRPNDAGLLLTVIQLYLLTNNHGSAITLIEKFFARLENSKKLADSDVRFAPGLVGVLVSLYAKEGRKAHVKTELAKAASYWRSKRKTDRGSVIPISLLRAAGTVLLESTGTEDARAAGELFAVLHDEDPNDRASTAGLIASYATSDPSKVPSEALQSLSPAARLVADIDALALEDAGVARPTVKLTGSSKDATKKRRAEDAKAKKKRIRPSRMPKDFVEGKKVDLERWQPLRDRSYWRPKGKKGKARAAGLTQGGVVEEEKGKQVAEPTKPSSGGGGAKKKKKGKGGKW